MNYDTPKLDRMVFSVDPRVVALAKKRYEVTGEDEVALREAVSRLYEMATSPKPVPLGDEALLDWLREARELAERVGKRWDVETLDEALTRGEGLVPLGFPPTEVAACTTAWLRTESQMTLSAGRRLVIDGGSAPMLIVRDLRIGQLSVFPTSQPVTGDVFAPRSFPLWLDTGPIQIGQTVSVVVENISATNLYVRAVLLCKRHEEVATYDHRSAFPPALLNAFYGKFANERRGGDE